MTTYVFLPGAGGDASHLWSRVGELVRSAGHDAVAVDFPADDERAGLHEYTQLVLDAIGDRRDVVLVAQSMAGFTAPLVAQRAPLRALVFVNAMIPAPGERAGEWWDNVGSEEARLAAAEAGGYPAELDLATYFLHDVAPEIAAAGEAHQRNEAEAAFETPCEFAAWPDVPIKVVTGAGDRFFPPGFQQRVARERLGVEADVLPGGHLMALSEPKPLADYLLAL